MCTSSALGRSPSPLKVVLWPAAASDSIMTPLGRARTRGATCLHAGDAGGRAAPASVGDGGTGGVDHPSAASKPATSDVASEPAASEPALEAVSTSESEGRAVETEAVSDESMRAREGTSILTPPASTASSNAAVDMYDGMRSSLEGAAFASARKAAIPASSSDTPPASRPDLAKPSAPMLSAAMSGSSLSGSSLASTETSWSRSKPASCSSTPPPTNMESSSVAMPSSIPSRSTGGWLLTACERSMSWLASLDSARAAIRSCSRIIARSDSRTTMRGSLPPAALASGTLSPSPIITSGLSFSAMERAMPPKHWVLRSMRTRAFEPDRVRRCAIAALVCCMSRCSFWKYS
mmetsp:Transcript_18883/g.44853  ORF Transcript_18883/g.44853 Transcript_18883/m.44853 type:complete len:350 (+) Transcript_18883:743-1792(+)